MVDIPAVREKGPKGCDALNEPDPCSPTASKLDPGDEQGRDGQRHGRIQYPACGSFRGRLDEQKTHERALKKTEDRDHDGQNNEGNGHEPVGRTALRVDDEVVLYRTPPRKTTVEQAVTEPSRQLVVDAGFDRLVATNWDSLVAGEPLVADFAVPSRLTCLTIRVDKKEDGILDGEPVVTFRMRFKNPLLRLVAGPIDVTYHRAERFLMRYEGLSNVSDPRGNNHTVRIDFPIAERRSLAPVEIAEWRAANNG